MSHSSSKGGPVRVRVDGTAGTIVLNRPDRRNALDEASLEALQQAFEDLHQEKAVRAVIITGEGHCFCAGSDLKAIQAAQQDTPTHRAWFPDVSRLRELLTTMLRFPKPIIAAVNGPAVGSGLALVAASDMALAVPEARFGLPEVQWGLTAGPTLPLLAFRFGASIAAQLAFRQPWFDAPTALQRGFVQEITPFELVWARARQWVDEIAQASPSAIAMNKRILNETVGEALITQISAATASLAATLTTEEAAEGVASFRAKRSPH